MKLIQQLIVLLLFACTLVSSNSCTMNDQAELDPTTPEEHALQELKSQISNLNLQYQGKFASTRSFGSWWNRVVDIVCADAKGAYCGYVSSRGSAGMVVLKSIIESAVSSSWEEAWHTSTLEDTDDEYSALRESCHEFLCSVREPEIDLIENNKYNRYGAIHNKAIIILTDRAIEDRSIFYSDNNHNGVFTSAIDEASKWVKEQETALEPNKSNLNSEGALDYPINHSILNRILSRKTLTHIYSDNNFDDPINSDPNSDDNIENPVDLDSSSNNSSNRITEVSDYENPDYIDEDEAEICDNFASNISSCNTTKMTVDYASRFSKIVEESKVSEDKKRSILLFSAVATYSKLLWSGQ